MPNREYGECTEIFIPVVPKKDHVPSELEKKIQKDLKLVEKSDLWVNAPNSVILTLLV